jgi:hypothetical protein
LEKSKYLLQEITLLDTMKVAERNDNTRHSKDKEYAR